MLSQVQPSYQQHNIEPKREVGQGQRIGLQAAVRSLVSRAVHIRTAIACVVQLDYPIQRDHRPSCQRHRLAQPPMTLRALMLDWPIPPSDHLWIASRVVHHFSPCFNLTDPSLSLSHCSPTHSLPPRFFFSFTCDHQNPLFSRLWRRFIRRNWHLCLCIELLGIRLAGSSVSRVLITSHSND